MARSRDISAPQAGRITSLDGVRGFACVIVMIHHALLTVPVLALPYFDIERSRAETSGFVWWFINSPLHLVWEGTAAVIVFFALSGYVLVLQVRDPRRYDWLAYYPHRLLRLYLPVIAAVAFAFALLLIFGHASAGSLTSIWTAGHPTSVSPKELAHDVALLIRPGYTASPLWSLKWEVWFSLLLPLFVFIAWPRARSQWSWVALTGAMAAIMFATVGGAQFMLAFLVGALLASNRHWQHRLFDQLNARKPVGVAVWSLIGVTAVLLLTARWIWPVEPGSVWDLVGVHSWIATTAAALVIVIALYCPPARRWFSSRLLLWLGRISFSLYLVHEPIIVATTRVLGEGMLWVSIPTAIALSVAVAYGFYRAVEEPSIRLSGKIRNTIASRRRKRAPEAISADR